MVVKIVTSLIRFPLQKYLCEYVLEIDIPEVWGTAAPLSPTLRYLDSIGGGTLQLNDELCIQQFP